MLGLLIQGFIDACKGIKIIRDSTTDALNRAEKPYSKEWNYPMYLDHNGQWRDSNTNEPLYIKQVMVNGESHTCITNLNTGAIKKDITAEKNHQRTNKAKESGATVVELERGYYGDPDVRGRRYRDLKTGELYVKRWLLNGDKVYMRASDRVLIRPADEVKDAKKLEQTWKRIHQINKEQDEIVESGMSSTRNPFNDQVIG